MDVGASEVLGRHFLAGGGFDERRPAQEDRAPLDDDGFIRHRRHIGAARGARSQDGGHLRDPFRRHACLVEEDAAEVIAIGEDLRLERQERPARIDEVDAGQAVLQRDVLRADVLLHRHREVGAALDRRVVRDDHHFAAGHAADPRDEPGAGRVPVVHVVRGERRKLEKGRSGIEQPADPIAHRQLALGAVPLDVFRAASFARAGEPLAQLPGELLHAVTIGLKGRIGGVDVRLEGVHVQSSDVRSSDVSRQSAEACPTEDCRAVAATIHSSPS